MKMTRKTWLTWMAMVLCATAPAAAQSPEFDHDAGSVRINGGSSSGGMAGSGVQQMQHVDPGYVPVMPPPGPAYGAANVPPPGAVLDPAFRAAAGLGGPTYEEIERTRWALYRENLDRAGSPGGETTIHFLQPFRVFGEYNVLAINPRLRINDYGEVAGNVGLIQRLYSPDYDRTFGGSVWYDYDNAHRFDYHRLGYQFETIGRFLSFRAGFDYTFGDDQRIYRRVLGTPTFAGSSIVVPVTQNFEAPFDNYYFEFAGPAPYLGKYGLEMAAGGYFLAGSGNDDSLGISGRLQWQLTEDVWIQGQLTNDDVFDTEFSLNVEITLPNGAPSRILRPNPVVMALNQSVIRNYRAQVGTGVNRTRLVEKDTDGTPLRIAHIDPNATTSGDGTILNPFMSVAEFMADPNRSAFDIIFVQPREDDTDINLNTGITITDTQRLIGNGDRIDGTQPTYLSSVFGMDMDLPFFASGPNPILSNSAIPGGTVVTLAGNVTEVSGFTIDGTDTGDGIVSAGPIDGFDINNVTFQNVVDAIRITSDTSANIGSPRENLGIVRSNNFIGTPGIADDAFELLHIAGPLGLQLTNNTVDSFGSGFDVRVTGGTVGTVMQNNTVTDSTGAFGAGARFEVTNGGELNFETFDTNTFSGGAGDGVQLEATAGGILTASGLLTNNTFNDNARDGMNVEVDGAGSVVALQGIGDGTDSNTNSFSGNGDDGLDVIVTNGGNFTVLDPVIFQDFSNNGDDGFFGSVTGVGSMLSVVLGDPTAGSSDGNTFNSNGLLSGNGSGIDLRASNGGVLNVPIYNNTINGSGGAGILAIYNNTTEDLVLISGNEVVGSGGAGVVLSGQSTPFTNIFVDGNLINNSTGGDGLVFLLNNSPVTGQLAVTNNGIQGNAGHGVNFDLVGSPINDLVIQGNIQGQNLDAGTVQLDFTNLIWTTSIENNSDPGLDFASITLDLTNIGQVWRPDITPFNDMFEVTGGTDLIVGLASIDGVQVIPGTFPLQDIDGNELALGGVSISPTVVFGFNDFQPGEQFDYSLSHAPVGTDDTNIPADGMDVTIVLADGRVVTGTWDGANPIIGAVAEAFSGISNNGLNGINISARSGSNITNLTIDTNDLQANGGNGIEITALNSTLPTAGNPATISNNLIANNGEDGFRMLDPDTNGTPVAIDFINNTFDSNGGFGINTFVDNDASELIVTMSGNSFTGNLSGGVRFAADQNASLELTVGGVNAVQGNLFDGNGDAGLLVELTGNATMADTFLIQNNLFVNQVDGPNVDLFGDGLVLRATESASFRDIQVLDNLFEGNAGSGLRVIANGLAQIHTAGMPTVPGLTAQRNAFVNNGGNGVSIERNGDAVIAALIGSATNANNGNLFAENGNHGLLVSTSGGENGGAIGTTVVAANNLFIANAVDNVHVDVFDSATTNVSLLTNVIDGMGISDDGVEINTNNNSFFGADPVAGTQSVFDGNIVMNNLGAGFNFITNDAARSYAYINGDTQQTQIFGNGDGVVLHQNGGVFAGNAELVVTIGNALSNVAPAVPGADTNPNEPDVVLFGNTQDAIRIADFGSGMVGLSVNNTLAVGDRTTTGTSRNGLSFNADGEQTLGVTNITVDNSTFTDFGEDGMHFYHDDPVDGLNNPTGLFAQLNVNVTNTVIGEDQFSFNGDDGIDIEVRDDGANFVFDNIIANNNGGDGLRMVVAAEFIDGNIINLQPDLDSNNDATPDMIGPNHPSLIGRPDYVRPFGDFDAIDVTAFLDVTNSTLNFNGQDGIELAIAAAGRLGTQGDAVTIRGNNMFGNARYDFYTRTESILDGVVQTQSVNRGNPANPDTIVLNPLAHLYLEFGDNNMPNAGNVLNPTVFGENGIDTFVADVFKPALRVMTNFNVIVPDDTAPPMPNQFTLGGVPVDEAQVFANNWGNPQGTYPLFNNLGPFNFQVNNPTAPWPFPTGVIAP